MMNAATTEKTLSCTRTNHRNMPDVFELLCPVRLKDWLHGWDYSLAYSGSGLEQQCMQSMHWSENSINNYLKTGVMLTRQEGDSGFWCCGNRGLTPFYEKVLSCMTVN